MEQRLAVVERQAALAQCRLSSLQAASAPQALERYEYQGQYGWQKQDRGQWLSRVQIEQRESQARRIQGQSGVRQM
ncbi:Rhs element Vgr protein, partial [Pseudomonas syringae pv. actinidiae ICMP 19095]